jgi:hypothetical protein
MIQKLSKKKKTSNKIFFEENFIYYFRFPMVNKATKRLHHPRFTTRRPHTYF